MKTREIYGGNYLTAEDLNGKSINVIIRDVTVATMNDDKKGEVKRAVLHFKNTDKTLILNVTNANMMEELTGSDETDDWIGARVCLYPTKVDFQGKRVLAVRIKVASNNRPTAVPVQRGGTGNIAGGPEPVVDEPPIEDADELAADEIPF